MDILLLILSLAFCLFIEGFFSGSEMAIVNADKYRLALAVDSGSKRALSALHLIKHPAKFFATTLLGTNICTISGSVISTLFIINRFGESYAPFAMLYWPFTLILGEIVPKSIYQHYADKIVLRVAPILFVVSIIFWPVIFVLSKLTDRLLGGVAKREGDSPLISRDELEMLLNMGEESTSDVRPAERTMISRIFDLADNKVKNISTPLVDVVAIPISASTEEAAVLFDKYGFSRLPVYDGEVINIVGVLNAADLLYVDEKKNVRELIKPAYYVPEEMPLDELMVAIKRRGEAIGVAVDEYGSATGIVTMEDLLEEVVGEIQDEHDDEDINFQRLGWHRYLVNGRMEVVKANEKLKLNIPLGEYKTVAGFIVGRFERIPKPGESFQLGRFKFIIHRSSDRAVLEVEVAQSTDSTD